MSKDKRNILIDTSPLRRCKKLDNRLQKLGIDRLDALILTHSLYDPAGNAAGLKDKYKAPVIAHRAEAACWPWPGGSSLP